MVNNNTLIWVCAIIIVGIIFYGVIFLKPAVGSTYVGPSYDGPYGKLIFTTNISDLPQNMTLYRVIPQNNDMIDYWNRDPVYNGNVTSEVEAPQISLKILEKYGGIPEGARLSRVETEYIEKIQSSNIPFFPPTVIEQIPESTVLNYGRTLGDFIVVNGYIRMELGRNGELLNLRKVWRTVTPAGTMRVIPATEALNKIQKGEVLTVRPKCICDLTVDKIQLAYLENDYNKTQEYLTPIWVFAGTLSSGDKYSYWVDATDPAYPLPSEGKDLVSLSGSPNTLVNLPPQSGLSGSIAAPENMEINSS
jgi:hypothetical protein